MSWQHYSLNDFKVVNWVTKLLSKHWYSQSGKECENSSVFRRHQKTLSDSEDCTDGVKVFHARAAVTQNARSPIVQWTVHGTISSDIDAERNRCRKETLLARFSWTRDSVDVMFKLCLNFNKLNKIYFDFNLWLYKLQC